MSEPHAPKSRVTVRPVRETLAPLDRPSFNLEAIENEVAQETGTPLSECQDQILEGLKLERNAAPDDYSGALPQSTVTDPVIDTTIKSIEQRLQGLSTKHIDIHEAITGPYGVVTDDVIRSQRLRLRLDSLATVVEQTALRGVTVVHSFIPAELLEGPGPLGFRPRDLLKDFRRDFLRALPETGYSFVRFTNWLELALIENPGDSDKGVCLSEWWMYRGRDFFEIEDPPARSWCLHLHGYGLARRAGSWATAKEIGDSFKEYFPCKHAVMARKFDLKKNVSTNIGRIGRYRSKLMGNKAPARLIPSSQELAVNARFWGRCPKGARDLLLVGNWPEIGPRQHIGEARQNANERQLLRRVAMAWDEAEAAWTYDSKQWLRSIDVPETPSEIDDE